MEHMMLLWAICYKLSFDVRAINHTNKIIDSNMGYSLTSLFGGTLESGIDVGQGINVGPGKSGKKNKRRALNTHVLCSE